MSRAQWMDSLLLLLVLAVFSDVSECQVTVTPEPESEVTKPTTINVKEMLTYKSSEEADLQNGGHRISVPGQNKESRQHVKAHDGFHNIEHEPVWAHWNDKFTPEEGV